MTRQRPEIIALPEAFRETYAGLISDSEALFEALRRPLPASFRVNTLKSSAGEIQQRFAGYGIKIEQTPWYTEAFVCPDCDPSPTLEHFLGKIYLQELTSMLPPLVVREELKTARVVVDACAAPGSKATQLAALMDNNGTLIANDVDYQRIRALKHNLTKDGAYNTVITHSDFGGFAESDGPYDIILVDAPCSSDGTVRKSPGLLQYWRSSRAGRYARQQRHLLKKAFRLLVDGGVLVYSTCALSVTENELIVHDLLSEFPAVVEPVEIPGFTLRPGIMTCNGAQLNTQIAHTRRVWPQDNDTDAFFLARIRKPGA